MFGKAEKGQRRVFCPTHKISFEVPSGNRILCEAGGHALAHNFPQEAYWEYCCDCQVCWPSDLGRGGKFKEQCPVCTRVTSSRYLCDECGLISNESDDPAKRKAFRISARGAIEPFCPGCGSRAKAVLLEHACEEAAAVFKTQRTSCPFCDESLTKQAGVLFCPYC